MIADSHNLRKVNFLCLPLSLVLLVPFVKLFPFLCAKDLPRDSRKYFNYRKKIYANDLFVASLLTMHKTPESYVLIVSFGYFLSSLGNDIRKFIKTKVENAILKPFISVQMKTSWGNRGGGIEMGPEHRQFPDK